MSDSEDLRLLKIAAVDPEASRIKGEYDAATNQPNLDTLPIPIGFVKRGDKYKVSVAGTFFSQPLVIGDVIEAFIDNPLVITDWLLYATAITGASSGGAALTIGTGDWILISGNDYRFDFSHGLGTTDIHVQYQDPSTLEFLEVNDSECLSPSVLQVRVIGNTQAVRVIVSGAVTAPNTLGAPKRIVNLIVTDTTLNGDNDFVLSDDSGAVTKQTITLPTAVGIAGKFYTIKKVSGGTKFTSIAPTGGETIDNISPEFILGNNNEFVDVVSNGTNWKVAGRRTFDFGQIARPAGSGTTTQPLTPTPIVADFFDTNSFSTPGRSTADQANNQISVVDIQNLGGDAHEVFANVTFQYDNSQNVTFEIYVNGVATGLSQSQEGKGSNDNVSLTINGFVSLTVEPSNIQLFVFAQNSSTITYLSGTLTNERIGG